MYYSAAAPASGTGISPKKILRIKVLNHSQTDSNGVLST
ncbi:hypothetical protein SALWKB12_0962 [Snodgrassella communis]|nr:hypothetical protein SALWKB12_0962 [Snodgrassella communis]